MTDNVIVRPIKSNEREKISRIFERAGWSPITGCDTTFVLTIPNPDGDKRWIVGTIGVTSEGRICNLVVESNHRRKGYGRRMLQHVMQTYPDSGLYLRVRIKNWRAILLYLTEGFWIRGIYQKRSFTMSPNPLKKMKKKATKKKTKKPIPPPKIIVSKQPITLQSLRQLWTPDTKLYKIDGKWNIVHFKRNIMDLIQLGHTYTGEIHPYIGDDRLMFVGGWLKSQAEKEEIKKISEDKNSEFRYYVDEKGTSWGKRFSRLVYKNHNHKVNAFTLDSIGNSLRAYTPANYRIVIAQEAEWRSGAFGDHDSCWFSFRSEVKDRFFESGHGYAVKAYDCDTPTKGAGRCWMYASNEHLYIFNARGYDMFKFKEILCDVFDLKSKEVRLNTDMSESYVETKGYVLGQTLPTDTSYTMKWR